MLLAKIQNVHSMFPGRSLPHIQAFQELVRRVVVFVFRRLSLPNCLIFEIHFLKYPKRVFVKNTYGLRPLPPAPAHCSLLYDCRFLALLQADLGILGTSIFYLACLVASLWRGDPGTLGQHKKGHFEARFGFFMIFCRFMTFFERLVCTFDQTVCIL